jgi:hypothetical protein
LLAVLLVVVATKTVVVVDTLKIKKIKQDISKTKTKLKKREKPNRDQTGL